MLANWGLKCYSESQNMNENEINFTFLPQMYQ